MKDILEAVDLVKSYHHRTVVDHVSVSVRRGEIVGLLGPNGAGKTTTFFLILGHIPQDGGRVQVAGQNITELPMYARARMGICLLPQEPSVFRKLTVEENLRAIREVSNGGGERSVPNIHETLVEFGLDRLAAARAVTLSGGERRRLEIARALMTSPSFILLDEPFTGIDPLAILDLQEIIVGLKNRGLGVLITDHSVRDTLKITDRAYIIDKGRILEEGDPESLVVSEEVKKRYLGDDFHME